MKPEEREVFQKLDGIGLCGMEKEIFDMDIDESVVIEDQVLERIKGKTYQKLGVYPMAKKRRHRMVGTAAAAVIALTLSIGMIGPDIVWAGVVRTLELIPGVNLMLEKNEGFQRYVLESPIESKIGSTGIKIKSLVVDKEMIVLITEQTGDRERPVEMYLEDNAGMRYHPTGVMTGLHGTEEPLEITGLFKNNLKSMEGLKLILDGDGVEKIPLILKKAESCEVIGPKDTQNNIGITAVASLKDQKVKVNVIPDPMQGREVVSYGFEKGLGAGNQAGSVAAYSSGAQGTLDEINSYLDKCVNMGLTGYPASQNEFYFDTKDIKDNKFNVELPFIVLRYKGSQTVKVDIPESGSLVLNKTVNLCGFPLTIKRVERVAPDAVKVHVDTGYNEDKNENLVNYKLADLNEDGIKLYYPDQNDNQLMESFTISVGEKDKQAQFMLMDPETKMKGPWKFNFDFNKE
ncbi:MAG: DUF4179 domain-containing protein [Clostridia bacterium]|nr:DUF4179 domain-containing protein [Clostridia bacterium]